VLADEQVLNVGDSPRRIADFALRNRLPSIGPAHYAPAGGLIGYGVVWTDIVRRSMVLVDKIFKGAKPAELPIQQATKFELMINLKTAKALGLTIPPSLLARADQVIE
jgi:putative ABC transport system substrate-binding protein